MSTRATIMISAPEETYFIYRHCDGFPNTVLPDIHDAVKRNSLVAGPAAGHLVALLFGAAYDKAERVQNYEMTTGFHGDESYRFLVRWDKREQRWEVEELEGDGE
jgi:hypothetical protein